MKAQTEAETKIVHFLEDGMTGPGARVFYRGETLTLETDSDDYELTVDQATGRSWLDLSEEEQEQRYGRVMFRPGPWPEAKAKVEQRPPLSPHEQSAREAFKDLEAGWREEDKWAKEASKPKFYSRTVRGGVVPDQFTGGGS